MRRMYSPEELKRLVKEVVQAGNLSISGDIEFENDVSIGGDLAVTGSINGEENPSVKPIYWHSLDIYKAGKTLLRAVILNNSNTPIDSIPKLVAWFESIENVDLLVNGAYSTPNDVYIKDVLSIRHSAGVDAFTFYYFLQDTAGYSSVTITKQELLDQGLSLQDSYINKIN
ncbi:MAG: hypothetical protein IKJ59_00370 [Clostridia bacterium]|nr:hypothetical protein [Clostridia bacterium]